MFQVGDMAIITASQFFPELVGTQVEVISPYALRDVLMPDGSTKLMLRYIVRMAGGLTGAMSWRNMRPLHGEHDPIDTESECAIS